MILQIIISKKPMAGHLPVYFSSHTTLVVSFKFVASAYPHFEWYSHRTNVLVVDLLDHE